MLVGELKVGMIVTPQRGWTIDHINWPYYRKSISEEEKKSGSWTQIESSSWTGPKGVTVRFQLKGFGVDGVDHLMYIGTKVDEFQWAGVLKHHRFLWNGKPVIMSGYDIKWLNIAEGFEHE